MMLGMDLRTWTGAKRGRAAELGRAIGVNPVLIRQWAAGRPIPVPHMAAIELASGGEVTRQEMCPHEWQRIWPELVSRRRSVQRRALGVAA